MHQVAASATGSVDRARHQRRPHIDVFPGIADDGGVSGGARGSMHANDLVARHGKHREGVVGAQIVLGGKGEFLQVVQRFQVVGMHAVGIEFIPVGGNVGVGMRQRLFQPTGLQSDYFVSAGAFDRLKRLEAGSRHAVSRKRVVAVSH
jgi:hypothetical protein